MKDMSIKLSGVVDALCKAGMDRRLVEKSYCRTDAQCRAELTKIVETDRLGLTDTNFRRKYLNYIKEES